MTSKNTSVYSQKYRKRLLSWKCTRQDIHRSRIMCGMTRKGPQNLSLFPPEKGPAVRRSLLFEEFAMLFSPSLFSTLFCLLFSGKLITIFIGFYHLSIHLEGHSVITVKLIRSGMISSGNRNLPCMRTLSIF